MDRFVETNNKLDARDHVRNATLRRVRHYLSDRYQRVYPDLKGMCERVSDSYRDRVVVELIQNAHDAHEAGTVDGRIKIVLDTKDGPFGSLTVANDGIGFLQKNFDALCSPTLTTKSVNESIGNKGVGFLSVFQVSSFPEIYSRVSGSSSYGFDGYCFRFADDEGVKEFLRKERLESDAGDVIANMPRLYLACPLNLQPHQIQRLADEGFATAVRLPLKNIESLASVKAQLAQLAGGDPPIQLFLSRIAEFSIDDGNGEPSILMRHWDVLKKDKSFRLLEVRCDDAKFIVAERTLQHSDVLAVIETDVAAERLPESWRKWEGDAVVSLAVTASGEPVKGRFYNFLPMGAEAKSPFDGHLDAPFYASIDRLKLQPGVKLNEMLLAASRELAVEAARVVKNELISNQKEIVSDFLFWHGEDKAKIKEALIATGEALIPVIGSRPKKSWASLEAAKLWKGDDFITPTYAAKVARFPVFDVSIGPKRVDRFLQFASGVGYPKPPDSFRLTDTERTAVLEGIADDLLALRSPIERWNRFYESLAGLFADKPMILAECRILLTARGDLEQTSAPSQGRARRGARLRTVFLPPLRNRDGSAVIETETLPLAVQRRLTYLHRDLGVARDSASAARQFLLSNGLIRDHETREILRLLAGAIVDPGSTADPDALRWSALETIKRIISEEDSSATMVAELGISVPTKSGWIRGGDAYFGSWRGTNGGDLQRLFEESTGLSKELDQEAAKLLIPYRDWAVRHGDVGSWVSFLRKVGVADQLRPMPAFSGTPPRSQPGYLSWQFSENAGVGAQQAEIWRSLMGGVANLANPYTTYTAAEAFKVPGQADFTNLGAAAGKLFARQVVRLLEERPALLEMTVYRPQHSHAPNRTNVPSPIAAFVRGIEWVPVAKGGFNKLSDSWLPGADGNPPPCISVVEWDFRSLRAEEGSTILVSSALRDSARLIMGISEALGEAVGSRKNVGEPLLALAATLISSGPVPHAEDYARALGVSVREILGVLGTSRAFIAEIAKSLRPIVQLYAGELAARQLAPGSNLATEDDVLNVLDRVRAMLPVSPQELLQRCRENPKLPALAVALDVDLRELNDILSALGPPYSVIDMTAEHEATLTAFLSRHAGFIRESIRASFRQLFAIGEDLTPYRTARDSIWPRLPVGYGLTAISIPHAVLDQWLAQWLNELGVRPLAALPSARESLEQVREANLKTIRALVPNARVAVLAKSANNSALASRWRDAELAERAVVELATTEGWIDFDRLDWGKCLDWLAKGGLWDSNWGRSLDDRDLGITEFDKAAVAAADVRAVRDASASRNQVNYSGGTFTIGSDSYGALADKISELAGSNLALQQTPTRIQQSLSRVVVRGGGGGTGGSPSHPSKRMPEEERSLIGFFGEMIAFAWLKARFGKKRVIDETCWRSLYRTQVYGGVGDDSLGYDFEVQNGRHFWYFEVKATAGPDPQARQMVELGSTEIARAESCRADGRTHYRILYVTNALVPETARLFVLPNPRSKDGLAFFTEQESAGVRLHFPLPSGG